MCKSIIGNNIKIGTPDDVGFYLNFYDYLGRFRLPLFSTDPIFVSKNDLEDNEICFVIRRDLYIRGLSLEMVDDINKIWAKLYEKNTRK